MTVLLAWVAIIAVFAATDGSRAPAPNSGTDRHRTGALVVKNHRVGVDQREQSVRIEGSLLDFWSSPVPNATVWLMRVDGTSSAPITTTSDENGNFVFKNITTATYRVSAYSGDSAGSIEITARELNFGDVDRVIRMHSGSTVVLHVIGGGAPINGALVDFDGRATTTRPDGTAILHAVAGYVQVTVTASSFERKTVDFFPSTDPQASIDRTITLDPGVSLAGRVVDPLGRAVGSAQVELVRVVSQSGDDSYWNSKVTSDRAGHWAIDAVAAGTYKIWATSEEFGSGSDSTVNVAEDSIANILVQVADGTCVYGIVKSETGEPVRGAAVTVADMASNRYFYVDSGRDGTFALRGLPSGKFELWASTETAASALEQVDLHGCRDNNVTLTTKGAELAGQLVGETPDDVNDVVVSAQSIASPDLIFTERTREDGEFNFGGLPPGDYALLATRDDAAGIGTLGHTIASTGHTQIVLDVGGLSDVSGRVVLNGQPLRDYGVAIAGGDPSFEAVPFAVHSADGVFHLPRVTRGELHLTVCGVSIASTTIDVRVDRRHVSIGDIAVTAGTTIEGRVTNSNGAPFAGAAIYVSRDPQPQLAGDDYLRDLLHGKRSTVTDDLGRYRITGADSDTYIEARAGGAVSDVTQVDSSSDIAHIDLQLHSYGSIDGQVDDSGAYCIASARPKTASPDLRETSGEVSRSGKFHLEYLAPGMYEVRLTCDNDPLSGEGLVTISSGQTSYVHIEGEKVGIVVKLNSPGAEAALCLRDAFYTNSCKYAQCDDSGAARFDVVPGTYKACYNGHCAPITVLSSVGQQVFTVPAGTP